MSAFFMPPDDLQLDELTNATLMKLEQFRDRTATGQSYKYKHEHFKPFLNSLINKYLFLSLFVVCLRHFLSHCDFQTYILKLGFVQLYF